jgi:hypothetical protein
VACAGIGRRCKKGVDGVSSGVGAGQQGSINQSVDQHPLVASQRVERVRAPPTSSWMVMKPTRWAPPEQEGGGHQKSQPGPPLRRGRRPSSIGQSVRSGSSWRLLACCCHTQDHMRPPSFFLVSFQAAAVIVSQSRRGRPPRLVYHAAAAAKIRRGAREARRGPQNSTLSSRAAVRAPGPKSPCGTKCMRYVVPRGPANGRASRLGFQGISGLL